MQQTAATLGRNEGLGRIWRKDLAQGSVAVGEEGPARAENVIGRVRRSVDRGDRNAAQVGCGWRVESPGNPVRHISYLLTSDDQHCPCLWQRKVVQFATGGGIATCLIALHASTMALKSCAEYIYTSSRNGRTSILIGLKLVHFWLVCAFDKEGF